MPHKNPWFIITHNEIHEIQDRLHHIESALTEAGLQQTGKIHCVLNEVRSRQP